MNRFKKLCDSVRRDLVYNILIYFGIPMKLVRLIKICLNETCIKLGWAVVWHVFYSEWSASRRWFVAIA